MAITQNQITALLLAGGKGSRMKFADKPLIKLGNKTIIEWIFSEAENHIKRFVINVNQNLELYDCFGFPVIPDQPSEHAGPLIGIHSGMEFIATEKELQLPHFLMCLPGDVPFFPKQLIPNLLEEMTNKPCDVVLTQCGEQIQPLFSLWSYSARQIIKDAIKDGLYGPRQIIPLLNSRTVSIDNMSNLEFLNINNKRDLVFAKKLLNHH